MEFGTKSVLLRDDSKTVAKSVANWYLQPWVVLVKPSVQHKSSVIHKSQQDSVNSTGSWDLATKTVPEDPEVEVEAAVTERRMDKVSARTRMKQSTQMR